MRSTVQALILADWLEELAVYGTARRPQSAETAYQLSVVIKNWYLVSLALNVGQETFRPIL